ncbi:dTDP-4-amino-4,6-dideoxy-D-galactose acyltransferase [Enterobacterales bacterium CwR94]|nr:dTDP-4-amino-4,6-dideoxy-D-galactose acyltransferase [Enterobacterales bacterium CwR94]
MINAGIKALEWESHFFGLRSGLLDFNQPQLLDDEQMQHFDVVQAKLDAQQTSDIDALCAMGFRLVEGEADLLLRIDAGERPTGVRIARAEHIPALRIAASEAFSHSRFRAPWFAEHDSARFYAQWIENAVKGSFDHLCLLAVGPQNEIQGFVSLREIAQDEARIGLLATLPAHQGKGIGLKLMIAAQDWCRARRLKTLRVATQLANLPALRLYLRCGASLERTSYWLYR